MSSKIFKYRKDSLVAWMLRLKFLTRWPLMRSSIKESVAEHTTETAIIAHHLAAIAKLKFNKDIDPQKVATYALYHEASEAGGSSDIPTPVKYASPELTQAIKTLEHEIEVGMSESYSDSDMMDYMQQYIVQNSCPAEYKKLVKAADKISMYLKAKQELNNNNKEFSKASAKIESEVKAFSLECPEVAFFIKHYLPSCEMTLDELVD